ncbi:hypothetical protein BC826DRAFT_973359 [Russula brevipes]|nr:hypothetical protein BC826DRAFT_973359 [Russula brevipes]
MLRTRLQGPSEPPRSIVIHKSNGGQPNKVSDPIGSGNPTSTGNGNLTGLSGATFLGGDGPTMVSYKIFVCSNPSGGYGRSSGFQAQLEVHYDTFICPSQPRCRGNTHPLYLCLDAYLWSPRLLGPAHHFWVGWRDSNGIAVELTSAAHERTASIHTLRVGEFDPRESVDRYKKIRYERGRAGDEEADGTRERNGECTAVRHERKGSGLVHGDTANAGERRERERTAARHTRRNAVERRGFYWVVGSTTLREGKERQKEGDRAVALCREWVEAERGWSVGRRALRRG